ncbi:hypothetical protein ACQEV2_36995 [Streptomyces sp. CA-251387]|uniref:hypothetical protein n=1 Tax=Streptomyces sp. CA-251387 TaxID=3240064 RepID=UPI003D8CC3DF
MGDELGTLVQRYESDNGRRGRNALTLLLPGFVGILLGVVLAIPAYKSSVTGDDFVPSVVLGCGFGAVLMGCWCAWLFLTRSDEAFELYVDGLVHAYRGKRRVVRWEDVADLVDNGKDTALGRAFGGDVNLRLKLAHGKPVVITGIVDRAAHLTMAVREAIEKGNRSEPA